MNPKIDTDIAPVLGKALPFNLWEAAIKQAKRSTLNSFKTGAIIFSVNKEVLGKGTSHMSDIGGYSTRTIHAEDHAIRNMHTDDLWRYAYGILVVTLGKNENFSYSSRPCILCADKIYKNTIKRVYYAERSNDGSWVVNNEDSRTLYRRAIQIEPSEVARSMRIPDRVPVTT